MEKIIKTFYEDREKFLLDVSREAFEVNGIIIGMILSMPKPHPQETFVYLKCLELIILRYGQQDQPSYCFYKFFSIFNSLLKQGQDIDDFFPIFVTVSEQLPSIPPKMTMKGRISELFIQNFDYLTKKYSNGFEFIQVFKIGKKNQPIFKRLPLILTEPVSENLIKLFTNIDGNYEIFLAGYKKLGQLMLNSQEPEKVFLVNFLCFVTETMVLKQNQDFIFFLSKNLQVLNRFMPANRIKTIENLLESVSHAEKNPQLEDKGNEREEKEESKQGIEIFSSDSESFSRYEKTKDYQVENKEKKYEEIKDQCTLADKLEYWIIGLKDEFEFGNYLNLDIIMNILEKQKICLQDILPDVFTTFAKHLGFPLSSDSYTFWKNLLPLLRYIIDDEEYNSLSVLLEQSKPVSQNIPRGSSGPRQRPSSRRQIQSSILKRQQFIESQENPYKDSISFEEFHPSLHDSQLFTEESKGYDNQSLNDSEIHRRLS